jgi:hypothetical protein
MGRKISKTNKIDVYRIILISFNIMPFCNQNKQQKSVVAMIVRCEYIPKCCFVHFCLLIIEYFAYHLQIVIALAFKLLCLEMRLKNRKNLFTT